MVFQRQQIPHAGILIILIVLFSGVATAKITDDYHYEVIEQDGKETDYKVLISNVLNDYKEFVPEICIIGTYNTAEVDLYLPFYKTDELIAQDDLFAKDITVGDKETDVTFCYITDPDVDEYLKFGYDSIIIIKITGAEHLDSGRGFIADIYDYVNESDNVTYTIPASEYARVTFEQNLTAGENMILFETTSDTDEVIVYEKDGTGVVGEAEYNSIKEYYYVLLNHSGSQDTFDLKSVGNVTYDYIYDPPVPELGDNYLTTNDSTIMDTYIIEVETSLDNIGSGPGTWNIVIGPNDANPMTRYDEDCADGRAFAFTEETFKILDVDVTGCDPDSNCAYSSATSEVYLEPGSADDNNVIVWTLQACPDASEGATLPSKIKKLSGDDATLDDTVSVTITAFSDANYPQVDFGDGTPADGSKQSNQDIFVNVSVSDNNYITSLIDFDDNLRGWWRFDEYNATHIHDYLGQSNGSIEGSDAYVTVAGRYGKGGYFDGYGADGYINISNFDDDLFTENNEMTFSVWLYPSFDNSFSYDARIYDVQNGSVQRNRVLYSASINDFRFNTRTVNQVSTCDTEGLNWNKAEWYHFAGVYNGTNLLMYWNGSVVANCLQNGSLLGAAKDKFVLGASFAGADVWPGVLDDLMLFNRSLSAAEILGLYNSSVGTYRNFTGLSYGNHSFTGYSQDQAGNLNSTEEWVVEIEEAVADTTLPVLTIQRPANTTYTNNTIWFNLTGNEALDWAAVELSGHNHSLTNSSGNWNYLNNTLANGGYNAIFWANDSAGNMNWTSIIFTVQVTAPDLTPPVIYIQRPVNDTYTNNTIWFNITTNETADWAAVELVGYNHTLTNSSGNWNYLNDTLPNATYEAVFWANDTNGNMNWTSIIFTVAVPAADPCAYTNNSGSWTITTSCTKTGQFINIDGNLTIDTSGYLNLVNSTLNFTSTYQFLIFAADGDKITFNGTSGIGG